MKASKIILSLIILVIISFSCDNEPVDFNYIDSGNTENSDIKWWILVHPSYGNSGIYLYNESTSIIERTLPLPNPNGSPHALDFDGEFLWLGSMGDNEPIYKLDPQNGEIISEIENIRTEGIASSGEYLYYSNYSTVRKIKKDGTLIEDISTTNSSYLIPDIAIQGNDLYYLRYSENQPVIRLNLLNSEESIIPNIENTGVNCLAVFNNEIITVSPRPNNEIVRFNIETGELISIQPTNISGWITAITPNFKK